MRSRARPADDAPARDVPASPWRQIAGGFLCNALNPKAPIYYGAWIMLLHWLWFSAVALLFAHHVVRDRLVALRHWIDRAFGVAMIALGLRVLTTAGETQ